MLQQNLTKVEEITIYFVELRCNTVLIVCILLLYYIKTL